MITWVQLWPLLGLPTVVLSVVCLLPTVTFADRMLGGGPIREALLNHLVLSWMPNDAGALLVQWFAGASLFDEALFAFLMALNVNALLLPVLYVLGTAFIRFNNWLSVTNLRSKKAAARR